MDFFTGIANGCNEPGRPLFTVTATEPITNCSESQSFFTKGFCPNEPQFILNPSITNSNDEGAIAENLFTTRVYPNPSSTNTTFTFEVFSSKEFNGIIELFIINGAILSVKEIKGASSYRIPFNIRTSGTYLIRTTSSDENIVVTNRIIIK